MNPLPRPDELPIPAPWWVFQALLLVTFLLHLLAMNVLVGGSFVAALGLSRGGPANAWLARRLLRALPAAFAATVTLGVAPLLFAQVLYGHLLYTATVLSAVPWLSVVALAMAGYALAYRLASQAKSEEGPAARTVWVQFGLLCAIAFVFVNVMTLAADPSGWRATYFADAGGTHLHLSDPQVVPRVLHVLVGAVAVGALFAALSARAGAAQDAEASADGVRAALRVFRAATFAQIPLGVVFLLAQPREVQRSLMGESVWGTAALCVGVILAGLVLADVTRALRSADPGAAVPRLCAVVGTVVASMVVVRDVVRRAWIAPHFRPEDLASAPQWGVLAVFAVTFLLGAAVLVWLIRVGREAAR